MKAVAKLLMAEPDGKFLLMYRSDHPTFGKDLDLPGGMTESNEFALHTALRETEEEIGLHIYAHSCRCYGAQKHRLTLRYDESM